MQQILREVTTCNKDLKLKMANLEKKVSKLEEEASSKKTMKITPSSKVRVSDKNNGGLVLFGSNCV